MPLLRISSVWVAALALTWQANALSSLAGVAPSVSYSREIRPILSDNCFACHGPDQNKRKAKLRLDVREEAIARKALVPGKPDESELITRIFSTDEDELMPPPNSHKVLSHTQKETLRRWVADGAVYEGHWAYTPPVRPAVAASSRHAIDFLVRQRLSQLGLKPSPAADRRTLARRLHFDLLGLPPQPELVQAFERDPSPDAYEQLVERLLASPRYGERMALAWLDVVRYADTIGYHSDTPRNVWPYRDYVIRAFNENKAFDEFTREQLAGDLLPDSTVEQKVASAFNRLLLTTEEGGAQAKDYEARMLTDRARAVGTVWLGQTIGCAQCHDHKFDPITARDFYSMGAFFADIQEPIIGKREPGMLVPDSTQRAEVQRLEALVEKARQSYEAPQTKLRWEWETAAQAAIAAEPHWTVVLPEEAATSGGAKLKIDAQGIIRAEQNPKKGTDTFQIRLRPALRSIEGIRLEALTSDQLPDSGPGRGKGGSFALTEVRLEDSSGQAVELADATATFEQPGHGALAAIDGISTAQNGWAIGALEGVPQAIYLVPFAPVVLEGEDSLILVIEQLAGDNAVLGRFRISVTAEPAVLQAPKTTRPPQDIVSILEENENDRDDKQHARLAEYHRSIAPELAEVRRQFQQAQKTKAVFEATVPHCLVSISMEKPRTVRILPRGDWMVETGEEVRPALPVYLAGPAPVDDEKQLTRLDLANWLVSRDNPLTARVAVNRLWKQFFGVGLARVLDDFGAQGEPPVNPALLDWLACEFMDSGWNVKHLVRLIVSSQTYQQSSAASRELLARDPDNRELARQSRWRIEAELVRDNALAIAGLLEHAKIGGPSAKPYQPDGYWENLNFPVRTYEASNGAEQYRRGLYTWWQRSFLHPSLLAFDAPTREECAADRSRSNIPQQALVLLNDPTYVEAARTFAARILREGGSDAMSRINWAFQQALCRQPRADELETIFNLLYKHVTARRADEEAAALLQVGLAPAPVGVDSGELAAWTSLARVLLNLHETITRS